MSKRILVSFIIVILFSTFSFSQTGANPLLWRGKDHLDGSMPILIIAEGGVHSIFSGGVRVIAPSLIPTFYFEGSFHKKWGITDDEDEMNMVGIGGNSIHLAAGWKYGGDKKVEETFFIYDEVKDFKSSKNYSVTTWSGRYFNGPVYKSNALMVDLWLEPNNDRENLGKGFTPYIMLKHRWHTMHRFDFEPSDGYAYNRSELSITDFGLIASPALDAFGAYWSMMMGYEYFMFDMGLGYIHNLEEISKSSILLKITAGLYFSL